MIRPGTGNGSGNAGIGLCRALAHGAEHFPDLAE